LEIGEKKKSFCELQSLFKIFGIYTFQVKSFVNGLLNYIKNLSLKQIDPHNLIEKEENRRIDNMN